MHEFLAALAFHWSPPIPNKQSGWKVKPLTDRDEPNELSILCFPFILLVIKDVPLVKESVVYTLQKRGKKRKKEKEDYEISQKIVATNQRISPGTIVVK